MKEELVAIATLCTHYEIELSFIRELHTTGLIEIIIIEQEQCIHHDHIGDLEKMIRLHRELHVNVEGIDIVFNLLEKERALRQELEVLRNKLSVYEPFRSHME